jgi:hypothetical protein
MIFMLIESGDIFEQVRWNGKWSWLKCKRGFTYLTVIDERFEFIGFL